MMSAGRKYLRRRFQQKGAYEKIINTDQTVAGYHQDHATALSPASVSQEVQGVSGALLGTVLRTV